ncbi:unknown protein [Seminavis robusta]|uniref:Uncharacterized protein n=1 Tax=Seminavis robusta TaxID=568900 RepID=A0A9N8H6P7_9STRA|nr:unknown protein [Seminavis robusta]|eukprot:Sro177_g077830.1 n/a (210) ;mRNA; r:65952-66581
MATQDATNRKGTNFKLCEDVELTKAFLHTSEDSEVGTYMKGQDFKKKIHEVYKKLIETHNALMGTTFSARTPKSIFSRFKRISRCTLKLIGIEATQPKLSGDTAEEEYKKLCVKTFCDRYKADAFIIENVYQCKTMLEGYPKWKLWEQKEQGLDENGNPIEKKKECPTGTKKAKQMAKDRELVNKLLNTTEQVKEDAKDVRQKAKDDMF